MAVALGHRGSGDCGRIFRARRNSSNICAGPPGFALGLAAGYDRRGNCAVYAVALVPVPRPELHRCCGRCCPGGAGIAEIKRKKYKKARSESVERAFCSEM